MQQEEDLSEPKFFAPKLCEFIFTEWVCRDNFVDCCYYYYGEISACNHLQILIKTKKANGWVVLSTLISFYILQMSTSSARYFGMFMLSYFHIFECLRAKLNQRTLSFDWRPGGGKVWAADTASVCGISPILGFPLFLEAAAPSEMSRWSDWRSEFWLNPLLNKS